MERIRSRSNSKKKKKRSKKSTPPPTKTPQSEEDSSAFELDENNFFLCVNQVRKVVVRSKNKEVDRIKECTRRKRIVIILRDVSLDEGVKKVKGSKPSRDRLSAAQWLKDHLLLQEIPSYIIAIPGLLQDLEAIQVMKGCVPEMDPSTAYHQLLLTIIQTKILRKKRRIVILNLEDKTMLCPDELKLFCETSCKAEVFTLVKTKGSSFQHKLEKLTKKICKFANRVEAEGRSKSERRLKKLPKDSYENNIENVNDPGQVLELDQNANEIIPPRNYFNAETAFELVNHSPLDPDSKHKFSKKNEGKKVYLLPWEEIPPSPGVFLSHENNLTVSIIGVSTLDENGNAEILPSLGKGDDLLEESFSDPSELEHESTDYSKDEDQNNGYDCSLSESPARVQLRKKRRHLSTTQHPELDDRKILKLLSNSKSRSKSKSDLNLRSSDSEVSLHLSLIFASRPKLFKICVTPDESQFSSAVFTRFPDMNQNYRNEDPSEANLYKGWIAVPTIDSVILSQSSSGHNRQGQGQGSTNNIRTKLKPKLKKAGEILKRILQPIGNFFSCESCTNNADHHNPLRRSGPSRRRSLVYPEIMLRSEAFDQKF